MYALFCRGFLLAVCSITLLASHSVGVLHSPASIQAGYTRHQERPTPRPVRTISLCPTAEPQI
ncbi:hypothetical protein VFPBJ_03775 [Purpureocillium lilacinum]|uniref:Uncharacterized protein n=1 Tax=Purpureocillium lilacinum TaxID=33203 RepID=A0A179H4P8_PURLI|nr:hypothetical protein VFPBJ_03775 [Purpureocillium lilacinum]